MLLSLTECLGRRAALLSGGTEGVLGRLLVGDFNRVRAVKPAILTETTNL